MPASSFNQASFLGGEWSPFAQGRTKDPAYPTAMNVCRNGFPVEEGAWLRRSGTRFAATTLNGGKGCLRKFDFEATAPYIMEFTDSAVRFFAAIAFAGSGLSQALANDFRLVTTNDNQQITNISSANPAAVTTYGTHGWSTGDQVIFYFAGASGNQMPRMCNRVFQITSTGAQAFTLTDPITGLTVDGSVLGWDASLLPLGSMIAARILKIATPYVSGAWSSLRSVQAETNTVLLQQSYNPRILSVATLPTAAQFATFSLASATFKDGPYLDPATDGSTITPNGTSGSVTLTASAATSINSGSGFLSTDVGRLIRLLSEPAAWASGTSYSVGNTAKFNGQYFSCIQANTGQQPDIATAYWSISTTAATWSWAQITARTSALVVTATIEGAALVNTNAVATWRLGLYSDTTGYPTCGVYYEGRIWLAGSPGLSGAVAPIGAITNRVDASMVNAISGSTIDMTPTASDGTVADDNAISYVFNATDVNPIYWMIAAANGILCGTKAGEWLIQASQLSDPITPTSIQAHRVTTYGCSDIEPEHTELTVCFVHRYNRKILEYFPDVFSGKYNAPNLSRNAKHLTLSGIEEIRYQQELVPLIWARCGDGSLIGATYKRATLFSSQGPEFIAWHRHDLGSGRTVESIATGPSADGTIDSLAMITTDSSGVRHVEIMQPLFDVDAEITDGWFADDAVVPTGGSIALVNGANWTLTLNGLWHLNGSTVTAWVGGMDAGDYLVTNGAIQVTIDADVENPDALSSAYLKSISSTTAYGALGCPLIFTGATLTVPCVVGFTYTSQGQLLRPDTIEQSRSPQGHSMAKKRRVAQFGALLEGAQGISFGTDFTKKMRACQFKSPGGTAYHKTKLFSGVYWDTLEDDWGFDSMLAWQVTRPYPASVVSLSGFMNSSEN